MAQHPSNTSHTGKKKPGPKTPKKPAPPPKGSLADKLKDRMRKK